MTALVAIRVWIRRPASGGFERNVVVQQKRTHVITARAVLMPKAVAIFQSPSSPGSGAASVDVRGGANPRSNGGPIVVQRSLGTHVPDVGSRAEIEGGNGHARQS